MSDTISPYQERLYSAVIFGHDRARQKAVRLYRVLWRSRRYWQAQALETERRLRLVEALCANEQVALRNPAAPVRADHINYALNPGDCRKPVDWDATVAEAKLCGLNEFDAPV